MSIALHILLYISLFANVWLILSLGDMERQRDIWKANYERVASKILDREVKID